MPFDTSEGEASAVLDPIVTGPAAALTAVAVVVAPGARESGWGAEAAVSLARRWRGGRRVLLVDLDLEQPSLHDLLGLANDEGVIDVIEYGVSPRRVMQPVDGGAFDLIAAGAWTTSPGGVLRHDSWARLLVEAAARRATILACVPSDADGADAVIERAGAVLVIAEPGEGDAVVERLDHPYAVLAVLTRPAAPISEPGEAGPAAAAATLGAADEASAEAPEESDRSGPIEIGVVAIAPTGRLTDEEFERIRLPRDGAARESLIAAMRERQRAARLLPPDTAPAGTDERAYDERADEIEADELDAFAPTAPLRMEPVRTSRYAHPLGWTVAIVLIASLLAGAWHFLDRWSEFGQQPADPSLAAPTPVAEPDTGLAAPGGEATLPFAVAIEAHRDVVTATSRVAELAEAEPGTPFHVAPLEREGTLFYHVMAGPVRDSASALALRDTLIARGHKTGPTPTDVREAPLAYVVDEHTTPALAAEQLDELERLGVPGYMVTAGAAGQPPRYRVYIGAFATRAEADVVGSMLRAAGVRDSLVTRTGSIIP